jgi:hypothetical protein
MNVRQGKLCDVVEPTEDSSIDVLRDVGRCQVRADKKTAKVSRGASKRGRSLSRGRSPLLVFIDQVADASGYKSVPQPRLIRSELNRDCAKAFRVTCYVRANQLLDHLGSHHDLDQIILA